MSLEEELDTDSDVDQAMVPEGGEVEDITAGVPEDITHPPTPQKVRPQDTPNN